jgi:hypothetical protein
MTVAELVTLLENKVMNLQRARVHLVAQGDVVGVIDIDNQVTETQATLVELRTLLP